MVVHGMQMGPHMWGDIWLRRLCSGACNSMNLLGQSTVYLGYEE